MKSLLLLCLLVILGCATANQSDLKTPIKVALGAPDSSLTPISIGSGQMIALDLHYCLPIQIRDVNEKVVVELKGGTEPQEVDIPPGVYTIFGNTPVGAKWSRKIEVKK